MILQHMWVVYDIKMLNGLVGANTACSGFLLYLKVCGLVCAMDELNVVYCTAHT